MDALTLFGLCAVSAMLACYALEPRSPWFVLGFAASCLAGSAYGFLQGAWPFGLVEGIWSLVALARWWRLWQARQGRALPPLPLPMAQAGHRNLRAAPPEPAKGREAL